jgi:glyoxalase family protein
MAAPEILGLHHVTATVADAQPDIDFYAGALGLRLVKKTVNFDNPGVYHFYYGNERGTPGTLMTTFPYAGKGVRDGLKGAGQITVTSFSVPVGSLPAWRERLDSFAVAHRAGPTRFREQSLLVDDPSGLVIELIEGPGDTREPWTDGAAPGAELAVRGIHGVTLTIKNVGPSLELLTGPLGYEVVGQEGNRTRLAVGGKLPGHYIEVLSDPAAPGAVNGLGTVHHVAMAIATDEEQLAIREQLLSSGRAVTEVRDRQYFHSIYFREPGGVLYEIATLPPGFTIDEELSALGTGLKLPPWEEPERRAIERVLPPVTLPRARTHTR